MKYLIRALFVCSLFLSGCQKESGQEASENRLRILTTFLPLQSHALAIAGEKADVEQLLDQETGPHDFQLSPKDVAKLGKARLLFANGIGLESWLDELVEAAGAEQLEVVDTSHSMVLSESPGPLDGAQEPGANPHVWLDPRLALAQARAMLAAMQSADPKNAEAYQRNAEVYFAELEKLDKDFTAVLRPLQHKNLVTFHDAFPYLAKRYGINYVGSFNSFPGREPAPQELAMLMERIKAEKVDVLFSEAGYAPKLLVEIARQTGAKVAELDTLEVGTGTADSYVVRMRRNLAALKAAFE